ADVEITLGDFALELRRRDVVRLQDARKAGEADTDEPGVAHHVKNIRERGLRIMRPQTCAERPLDIAAGGQARGRGGKRGGKRSEKNPSFDNCSGHNYSAKLRDAAA